MGSSRRMNLSEYIYPDINAARSVNLERDQQNISQIHDYQITAKALEILRRFNDALKGERVTAWSLTGPYGMGKSSFVNYLLALTAPHNIATAGISLEKLMMTDAALGSELACNMQKQAGDRGFFRIFVTAAYESINHTLIRGFLNALTAEKAAGCKRYAEALQQLLWRKNVDSSELFAVFLELQKKIQRPVILVIDEFGKNLDYMSHHHDQGDLYIMQRLAETPSTFLWVCLHQAFDEYASGLSTVQRSEWSKVQGRFEDISFVESTRHMLDLMQIALKRNLPREIDEQINQWAKKSHAHISETNLINKEELDQQRIVNLYPLHPIASITLIELCRRFAQNDRTLLSFMASGDRLALPAKLQELDFDGKAFLPILGLDVLYDYFFNMSSTAYLNHAESQKWIEINDIIQNSQTLDALQQAILKTIGVLNLLSSSLGINACMDSITSLIGDNFNNKHNGVQEALRNLIDKGIVLYREYSKEYRLWEGSDFNIQEAIRDKKAKLAIGNLDSILSQYLKLPPLIASRHAYETGTVRRYERRWMDSELLNEDLVPKDNYDGLILYCYGNLAKPLGFPPEICADRRPLLTVYSPSRVILHELALEVAATRSLLEGNQELIHDGVARKEVKYRLKVAEQRFREYLSQAFEPGSSEVQWYSGDTRLNIESYKELSLHLSRFCDLHYDKSPYIGNEMISYENLTSAAAKARRELVEAMVDHTGEEQLGFSGYGPEVAVYRSLLLAQGLHTRDENTQSWMFTLNGEDERLKSVWLKIESMVLDANDKGANVAEILSELRKPPFGMRLGPAPIYICLYLLVKSEEIAVFQEGSYCPYLKAAEAALMVKRPELFTLKRIISNHVNQRVFDIYQSLLRTVEIEEGTGLRNSSMLGVLGPLVKFVEGLPAYSRKTREISREAQQIRLILQTTSEPMRVLFDEIPAAVGLDVKDISEADGKWQEELKNRMRAALLELSEAYHALNSQVQQTVLNIFGAHDLNALYRDLHDRSKPLLDICDDTELKSVLQSFLRPTIDPEEWIRGIAGMVIKKPLDAWNDQDFLPFAARLRDVAERMRQLEELSFNNGLLLKEEQRLLSLMLPGGELLRKVVNNGHSKDASIKRKVEEILALPDYMAKSILISLAESLLKEESDESA